jgi:hypothetical protein
VTPTRYETHHQLQQQQQQWLLLQNNTKWLVVMCLLESGGASLRTVLRKHHIPEVTQFPHDYQEVILLPKECCFNHDEYSFFFSKKDKTRL